MLNTGKNTKNILNEIAIVKDDKIKQAIRDVRRVRIYYDDHKDVKSQSKGYAMRYILPVAYGTLKNGKKAVRAYQTAGSTKRGVPKWKLFLVDNIVDWQNSTRTFKKYKQALLDLGLNVNGDKHMTTLYAITPFANPDVQVAKYSHEIDPEPITKNDVIPSTTTQQTTQTIAKKEPLANTMQPQSIDNRYNLDYNVDIESPNTEPITKTDIGNQNQQFVDTTSQIQTTNNSEPVTEPITKQDIENDGEIENGNANDIDLKDNDFVKRFNDLTDRMNNLYNNEEEK